MKKKVIGFVQTHWDREWYREFETFRLRLIEVFDNVLEMLSSNALPVFYFDGQTSALEDYLELRPEKEELVRQFISQKKLFIGPMYCSIDEFLSSAKLMNKNLEFGIKYSRDFGGSDFIGYYSDTFGHTPNIIPILKSHNIDTAVVWRGCGEIPSEFTWSDGETSINCINLIRGYFNDFFHIDIDIEKRTELIKDNLDKIAKYSGDVLLMPIGGDHLGVPQNLMELVSEVNDRLEDYEIVLGSIFDYIELVKDRFTQFTHIGELRDNSKTFILDGSFSSRLDLKRMNIESTYNLEKAERLVKSHPAIDYAYKLLLQNQAHDSIYGCSLDDVHKECVLRYKKINQIANYFLDKPHTMKNLGNDYQGTIEFKSSEKLDGHQLLKTEQGFAPELMFDTLRVPVTEDWGEIYTYLTQIDVKSGEMVEHLAPKTETDVFVTDNSIGNSNIFMVVDDCIKIGNHRMWFVDTEDNGDSYNDSFGKELRRCKILSSKKLYEGSVRSALELTIDEMKVRVELDNYSKYLTFKIDWENDYTNHKLSVVFDTNSPITETYSEDLNKIIRREFDPEYDIQEHLPKEKGIEAKTNTAPMQRGVWANNVGVVTRGLTQYEVFKSNLSIPILRSTDKLSNPSNPARTTPAGPPYWLSDLKQLGKNTAEFSVFVGRVDELEKTIDNIFNFIV